MFFILMYTISDQNDQPQLPTKLHRDNAITDHTDKQPRRTKRDVTSAEKQDIDRKSTTKTLHSATSNQNQRQTNSSHAETVRTARQLRPPPIAASPWSQYADSDQRNNHFQPAASFNRFPGTPQLQHSSGNNGNTANRYYKDNSNANDFHPLVNLYSHGNSVSDLPKHPTYTLTNGASNNFRPYEERERERERERDQLRPKEFDYFPTNYKTTTKSTPAAAQFAPVSYHQSGLSQPLNNHNNAENLPDNFSFFHQSDKNAKNPSERDHRKINPPEYSNKVPNVSILPNATPKNHFISFSTVGGFFNNHPSTTPAANFDNYKNKYRTNYNQANNGNGAAQPSFENVDSNRFNSYYPTTPKPPANYYTVTNAQPVEQLDGDFYSAYMNQVQKNKSPAFHDYEPHSTTTSPTVNTSPRPSYYISQLTEKTFLSPSERPAQTAFHRPASLSSTPGPVVGVDFDFNKFIERIRQDQLTNLKVGLETTTRSRFSDDGSSSAVTLSTKLNALPSGTLNRHRDDPMQYPTKPSVQPNKFFTTKTVTTLGSEEYYYDDDEDEETTTTSGRPPTRPPTTTTTTTRAPKGYEQFIKSIPKPVTKLQPIVGTAASAEKPDDVNVDDGGDDDDDDEYYYDDDEYDFHVPPPNKYMPMSETRSPRPTTPYPGPRSPPSRPPAHTDPNSFGVTQRPVFGTRTDVTTSTTTTPVPPAIIQFPKDIFQDLQPIGTLPRYLNNATLRPYTIRTRLLNTNPGVQDSTTVRLTTSTASPQTTTTTASTTTATATTTISSQRTNGPRPRSSTTVRPMTTTTRKVYTIRPYRGQPKWKNAKSVKGSDKKNQLDVDDKTQPSRYRVCDCSLRTTMHKC